MLSQITHVQSSNIHPLVHMLGSCSLISLVVPFLQFTPTASYNVTVPRPSKGHEPPERRRAVQTKTGTKGKWPSHTQSTTFPTGLSTLHTFLSLTNK